MANKRNLLEIIPFALFCLFGTSMLLKLGVPYAGMVTTISISLLSMLYFYAGYWLFNTASLPVAVRIISGVIFSLNNIACLFTLMRWPYGKFYGLVSLTTLGILLLMSLLSSRRAAYKPILYRCVVFVLLLSALLAYRSFSA